MLPVVLYFVLFYSFTVLLALAFISSIPAIAPVATGLNASIADQVILPPVRRF
jgi:hypothetical protein